MTATATATTTMAAATRVQGLQGPKPMPLMINKNSSKVFKRSSINNRSEKQVERDGGYKPPVIIYLQSPEVVHVHPHEFMATVQRLTGKLIDPSSHGPNGVIKYKIDMGV